MSFRIDSALLRAKKCAKSGAFDEAEAIYRSILSKFPKNNKAIQAYRKFKLGDTAKALSRSEPTQESINELIKLYNSGHFEAVLTKMEPLIRLFTKATILLSLQSASNVALTR